MSFFNGIYDVVPSSQEEGLFASPAPSGGAGETGLERPVKRARIVGTGACEPLCQCVTKGVRCGDAQGSSGGGGAVGSTEQAYALRWAPEFAQPHFSPPALSPPPRLFRLRSPPSPFAIAAHAAPMVLGAASPVYLGARDFGSPVRDGAASPFNLGSLAGSPRAAGAQDFGSPPRAAAFDMGLLAGSPPSSLGGMSPRLVGAASLPGAPKKHPRVWAVEADWPPASAEAVDAWVVVTARSPPSPLSPRFGRASPPPLGQLVPPPVLRSVSLAGAMSPHPYDFGAEYGSGGSSPSVGGAALSPHPYDFGAEHGSG